MTPHPTSDPTPTLPRAASRHHAMPRRTAALAIAGVVAHSTATLLAIARTAAVSVISALAIAAAIAIAATGVAAQGAPGIEDQRNTPTTGTTSGCGTSGASLFQSLTPRGADVVAIDLLMRAGGSFPADGAMLRIALRDGGPAGAVVATADAFVAGPLLPGTAIAPRFVFASAASVRPGASYVIEMMSPAPAGVPAATIASVFAADGDPYPRGTAFGCSGVAIPDRDYSFVTYTSSLEPPPAGPPTSALPRVEPTATPAGPLCWQIAALVPRAAIDAALADPASVAGYGQLEDPGKPEGPYNRRRMRLTMRALEVPYHPLFNGLVYRAGCP